MRALPLAYSEGLRRVGQAADGEHTVDVAEAVALAAALLRQGMVRLGAAARIPG